MKKRKAEKETSSKAWSIVQATAYAVIAIALFVLIRFEHFLWISGCITTKLTEVLFLLCFAGMVWCMKKLVDTLATILEWPAYRGKRLKIVPDPPYRIPAPKAESGKNEKTESNDISIQG